MGASAGSKLCPCCPKSEGADTQGLEDIAKLLQRARSVITMVGAGMSVSAGIPDFRSPTTGLYNNLQKYNLPCAEAVFDIDYFSRHPHAFYMLCKELWPGRYQPTLAHYFIVLLHQKQLLRRCYTQNIDSLETLAGLPKDKLVAAHGNFDTATCLGSRASVPVDEVKEAVMDGTWEALRDKYGGLVKPDIVFFGEQLPNRFRQLLRDDFSRCDLLLVLGTSLQVYPFAGLVNEVKRTVPRLLINREKVGEGSFCAPGFKFEKPGTRDVFFEGDCDQGVRELAKALGWEAELDAMLCLSPEPSSKFSTAVAA